MKKYILSLLLLCSCLSYAENIQELQIIDTPDLTKILSKPKPPNVLPKKANEDINKDINVYKDNYSINTETKENNELIRELFPVLTESIKSNNLDKFKSVVSKQFILISSNQEILIGKDRILDYFPQITNSKSNFKIDSYIIEPSIVVDFIEDGNFANVYGRGFENYSFNSKIYQIPTKWSALVLKEDEKWKIKSLHLGVDFLGNSFIKEFENSYFKAGIIGIIFGLILGLLITLFNFL